MIANAELKGKKVLQMDEWAPKEMTALARKFSRFLESGVVPRIFWILIQCAMKQTEAKLKS